MLTTTTIIACGLCVQSAIWYRFPAIDSWVFIFPSWLLTLAVIRSFGKVKLLLVPSLPLTLILLMAVFGFAPGRIGPPLGYWIPISCIVGTLSAFKMPKRVKLAVFLSASFAVVALLGFGSRDYAVYNAMEPQERLELVSPIYRPSFEAKQQEPKR